jgi:uncharacterized protein (TIGR00725 family)
VDDTPVKNPSRIVAVFGASSAAPGDDWFTAGERCGRLLAVAGFTVATGGYGGVMEAVSRGAAAAGAHVIGVTAPSVFPDRPGANDHVAEERRAASLTERIHELVSIADAAIALDGSLGTATELLVAWNVAFVAATGAEPRFPVVAVGQRWKALVPTLAGALDTPADLIECVDDVDAAVALVSLRLGR